MIKGKVARILNEYQLILNVGAQQGVTPGMEFVVYEEGEEVKDPDSGASLGRMEIVKGEVVVSHVQDTMCLAQSKEMKKEATPTVLSAKLAEVTTYSKSRLEKEHQKLYVKPGDITALAPAGPIAIGDLVRSVK